MRSSSRAAPARRRLGLGRARALARAPRRRPARCPAPRGRRRARRPARAARSASSSAAATRLVGEHPVLVALGEQPRAARRAPRSRRLAERRRRVGLRLTVKRALHAHGSSPCRGLPAPDRVSDSTRHGVAAPPVAASLGLRASGMRDRPLTLESPDVQAQAPAARDRPLARRRDRRREGHPDPPGRRRAALLGAPRVLRRPRPRPEGRAHVALRGGRQRGDRRGRARRVTFRAETSHSGSPSSCASARARCAPRSRSRRATPSTSRRRSRGSTRRRSTRCYGIAVATERGTRRVVGVAAQGMTACPCAQELVGAARAAAARGGRLQRRRDRAHPRRRPGRHAQPARPRHAARRRHRGRAARDRRARRCSRSSRTRCPPRSTS